MAGVPDITLDLNVAFEDASIGVDEPFDNKEAKEYFKSVGETEALNYVMMLHDMHAISFDRLGEFKKMIEETPSVYNTNLFPKG